MPTVQMIEALSKARKIPFDSYENPKSYYMFIHDYWIKEGFKSGDLYKERNAIYYDDPHKGRIRVLKSNEPFSS